jgi:hypothetical protein
MPSLDWARQQQAKSWELRTAATCAQPPVSGWFTEGFDTPVLRQAKVLLDESA